jgi:hypothetical protein
MDDSDTPREGQHDEQFESSSRTVNANPPDAGTRQALSNLPSSASAPAALLEDPFEHLTPGQRFAKALERRDALVRKLSQAGKKV